MERETSYRELFELSPDAILIMEGDRFVDCNPAAVRMLRFSSKQALLKRYSGKGSPGGKTAHPADISPPLQPDGRDSFQKANEILVTTFERGSHTFEWEHLCADGEPILVEVQLTVVERGEQPRLHVVWRDIGERKRLEAELSRAQRLEAVGRLAGGVAHDFNNLLVVIISYTEMLEEGLRQGTADPDHVAQIRRAAEKAAELSQQLLAFSRGQPAQSRPTDLRQLVNNLGSMVQRLIGERVDLVIEPAVDKKPITVVADPNQLEQIVLNLAANARDAMPRGGELSIGTIRRNLLTASGRFPAGPYAVLRVTDTGTGMTPEQIERAFDPFYTTKSLGKGTGLGLATVYAIAEQSGGHASIRSKEGSGTTVEVVLPLSQQAPVPLVPEPEAVTPHGGGETVLLVEDEAAIRDLFEASLTETGYRVIAAVDGLDALERIEALDADIDLLVTDVVMPRLSGPELVERLLQRFPQLRVLYMSGYSAEASLSVIEDKERAVVLQKPFSPSSLLREVRRSLDRDSTTPG